MLAFSEKFSRHIPITTPLSPPHSAKNAINTLIDWHLNASEEEREEQQTGVNQFIWQKPFTFPRLTRWTFSAVKDGDAALSLTPWWNLGPAAAERTMSASQNYFHYYYQRWQITVWQQLLGRKLSTNQFPCRRTRAKNPVRERGSFLSASIRNFLRSIVLNHKMIVPCPCCLITNSMPLRLLRLNNYLFNVNVLIWHFNVNKM